MAKIKLLKQSKNILDLNKLDTNLEYYASKKAHLNPYKLIGINSSQP